MQRYAVAILVLAVLGFGCGDRSLGGVTSPDAARTAAFSFGQVPPGNPGQPGGLVRGTGTAGLVPLWISPTSLGDSPIKIDASGNVILRPGISLYILNADESDCIQITGDFIRLDGAICPSF